MDFVIANKRKRKKMMYIILDTNILIHYNSFEDIPWGELMGCDELTFVFPALVMEEVDKVKDRERGRVQRRAKAVSSRLGQLLVDEVQGNQGDRNFDTQYIPSKIVI